VQVEKEMDVNDGNTHLMNIGRLVEDMENKMRSTINDIYFSKTQEVCSPKSRISNLTG
jgi:capping protein beta